ncbi:MAG: type II toxin-antitoxin system HicA family toxin [Pirellulaceae bacterium]|nr:type II toxin-antitoxin system HicA family toxin [Pirellulaceae bacterium]
MKLPRDLSGTELAQALSRLGYAVTRQKGTHMRLTTVENGEHHVTIPDHSSLRVGTLSAILNDIADHFDLSRDELLERLFEN